MTVQAKGASFEEILLGRHEASEEGIPFLFCFIQCGGGKSKLSPNATPSSHHIVPRNKYSNDLIRLLSRTECGISFVAQNVNQLAAQNVGG